MIPQAIVEAPGFILSEGYCQAVERYLEMAICRDSLCIYREGCRIYKEGNANGIIMEETMHNDNEVE